MSTVNIPLRSALDLTQFNCQPGVTSGVIGPQLSDGRKRYAGVCRTTTTVIATATTTIPTTHTTTTTTTTPTTPTTTTTENVDTLSGL